MAKKIILVTGGQRSGKSEYAEQLALSLSASPVYMATATVGDDDMRRRVEIHQARRGPAWTNIEEPVSLSRHDLDGKTVLIDCVTLWATNIFFAEDEDTERALAVVRDEFNRLIHYDATFIFVTNEIGMGGVSANRLQRHFTDLQGLVNRIIATAADEVILMVSGIAVKIK